MKEVEETYAGAVADNTSTNLRAFKIINEKYPKLLNTGCAPHVVNLLPKDMFTRIQEFKNIETAVKFCVKFVREHRIVKKAYLRLCNNPEPGGKKGTMVLMYPDTRFGYVDLMLESFQINIGVLERLVD